MTFKILSLDGGGIRGVVSAQILKYIETELKNTKNQELHEYFDLIAGTSTGSILAAGIACGKKADDLINLYKHEGKNIFLNEVRQRRKHQWLSLFMESYGLYPHECGENKGLAQVLKNQLTVQGQCQTMKSIKKPLILLILAYDVLSRNTTWFSNDDSEEWYYKNEIKLWEICTASASAPTFFPPYPLRYYNDKKPLPHIDGGVSANNPELAAVVHALSMTRTGDQPKIKIDEIAVLSIGTGKTTTPYEYSHISKWKLQDWLQKIPDIFLDPAAENSNYMLKRVFTAIDNDHYLRLNFALNEQFEQKKQQNQLRNLLDKPYNQYIYKETKKYKEICEDIDNPDICHDLIYAAQCYLKHGEFNENGKTVSVQEKIQQFIESH